uniref:Uncharacterized protein n=1 Tax=Cacopsylla melanoneura TaxID=428564 RepID=A0A8D8Y2R7_9HEMI
MLVHVLSKETQHSWVMIPLHLTSFLTPAVYMYLLFWSLGDPLPDVAELYCLLARKNSTLQCIQFAGVGIEDPVNKTQIPNNFLVGIVPVLCRFTICEEYVCLEILGQQLTHNRWIHPK